MRIARYMKNSLNFALTLFLFLLIYYAMNEKEMDTETYEMEENSISRLDLRNEERKRERPKKMKNEFDTDLKREDLFRSNGEDEDSKSERKNEILEKGVVVVVLAEANSDEIVDQGVLGDLSYDDTDTGVESLEAPAKPPEEDVEDEDMLRNNDVMVGDVVVDKSDDLALEINNTFEGMANAFHLGEAKTFELDTSFEDDIFYNAIDLLPPLKKPPSERNSPGEFGHPFIIPPKVVAALSYLIVNGYRHHGFNTIVSDIISPHRNLGDRREEQCKEKLYKKPLPSVSVIICFQNEAMSTLRRTLYSVLETVPALLLQEVILVDDSSNLDHLMGPLENEVRELSDMVTLIRSPTRIGIAKARILGMKRARGDVVAFLDSHCECYEGWIEPLLDRIRDDRTVVAMPVIEIIDQETFAFSVTPMQMVQRGGMDWTLTFRWTAPPRDRFENPRMDMSLPIASPTMAGGVFCIDREYFKEMGLYDEGIEIWGAENMEMSFRIWMCGGRLEILPCSHVGHIFRNRGPDAVHLQTVLKNKRRVAAVWMDEYKDLFLKREPYAKAIPTGNVTLRHELRNSLDCKSFTWYLENVYPDLYVPELNPLHSGSICCRFGFKHDVCLDTHNTEAIPGRLICVDAYQKSAHSQYFEYTKQDELRQTGTRDICLGSKGNKIEVQRCGYPTENREMAPDTQRWEISPEGTIMNFRTALCITASTNKVWLDKCDSANKIRQTWKWR